MMAEESMCTSAPGMTHINYTSLPAAGCSAGEWEGVTASFEPDGQPKALPHIYVPSVSMGLLDNMYDVSITCPGYRVICRGYRVISE